jgi:hypothetical protein
LLSELGKYPFSHVHLDQETAHQWFPSSCFRFTALQIKCAIKIFTEYKYKLILFFAISLFPPFPFSFLFLFFSFLLFNFKYSHRYRARFRVQRTRFRVFNFGVYQISVFGVYWGNYRSSKWPCCLMQYREAIAHRGRQRRAYGICRDIFLVHRHSDLIGHFRKRELYLFIVVNWLTTLSTVQTT